jgi:hypothetical protein
MICQEVKTRLQTPEDIKRIKASVLSELDAFVYFTEFEIRGTPLCAV